MFLDFEHHYRQLPQRCWSACDPTPVPAPRLIAFNAPLARQLGMKETPDPEQLAEWVSGNQLPPGADPLAMAYAGHQFGTFVPQLGDGRALLLGEVRDGEGRLRDIQLKGAGRTPFSRGGDGRAPLGPVLREYLVSEAMHALGISTTRALAAVTTGERLHRRTSEPGAVLTRVASSHIRIGTFQFLAYAGDEKSLQELAEHSIERHYPELGELPNDQRYLALFDAILQRQAALVAQWMGVGFIHGVMNTDNMSVAGDTIDYGPCAFMDRYHAETVFSSIDEGKRYAYRNQPTVAQWNLARLAETLLPLIDDDDDRAVERATQVLQSFPEHFQAQRQVIMSAKLGLEKDDPEALSLGDDFLKLMQAGQMDFTLSFDRLYQLAASEDDNARQAAHEALVALTQAPEPLEAWLSRWQAHRQEHATPTPATLARMRHANPLIIPRNHRVEEVIAAAVDQGDFTLFETLLALVTRPFEDTQQARDWAVPPAPSQEVLRTFCGT
ncbi:YdiU family protein [Vreelandella rituensis]|uniref:Protein nucleotidyltransferase YdiU n=1 Tax=Vreelandella rituensis TaxID=2282306 RepID=A0A368U7L7_9GAMM|nr:YdiU family protein [Halomonas rituensis]RCV92486.1 YdiU family protein [Halomonas rituensis]